MARQSGKSGSVTFDSGTTLGVTKWDMDQKCDAVDTTGMDSAGAKEFIPGLTEFSGTFEGNWDGTGAPPMAGAVAAMILDTGASTYDFATAIITSLKPTVDSKGVVTFSCAFQGSGALVAG